MPARRRANKNKEEDDEYGCRVLWGADSHPLKNEVRELRQRLSEKEEGLSFVWGLPGSGKESIFQEALRSKEASGYMVVEFGPGGNFQAKRPWSSLVEVCRAAMALEKRPMPDLDGIIREERLDALCAQKAEAALGAAGIAVVAAVYLTLPPVEVGRAAVAAALVAGVVTVEKAESIRVVSVTFVSLVAATLVNWAVKFRAKRAKRRLPIDELVHISGSGHAGYIMEDDKNSDDRTYKVRLLTLGGSKDQTERVLPVSDVRPAISNKGSYMYKSIRRKKEALEARERRGAVPSPIIDDDDDDDDEEEEEEEEEEEAEVGFDDDMQKKPAVRPAGSGGQVARPKAAPRNAASRWQIKVMNNHTDQLMIEVERNGRHKKYPWDMLDHLQYSKAVTRMSICSGVSMHHSGGAVPPQFQVPVPVSKGDIVRALLRGDVEGRRNVVFEHTITGDERDLNVRGCELSQNHTFPIPNLHETIPLAHSDDPWSLESIARVEVFAALRWRYSSDPRERWRFSGRNPKRRPLLVIRRFHVICSLMERATRGSAAKFLRSIAQL
eukprot:Hpha_TRINITY_DN16459_c1_g7::TRINITY_DN16459_c1_g7_i3::g.162868::m.162868